MAYVAPEVVAEVKQIDLFTYLKNYEPWELKHFSGNTYTTKTHDSLKISNGKWMWWSGLIYESSRYRNAVFVGKDETGKARYATTSEYEMIVIF